MVPSMRLKAVVLPEPFGPISAVIDPSGTTKEQPSMARTPPKCFSRPFTSSNGLSDGATGGGGSRSWISMRAVKPLTDHTGLAAGAPLLDQALNAGNDAARQKQHDQRQQAAEDQQAGIAARTRCW